SSSTTASTWSRVASAGRSRRRLAMPISAQSRCLAPTYHELAGSSPTSTVPSPGTAPRPARAATRVRSSSLIVARTALPSRIVALMGPSVGRGSVGEVSGAGEVGAHAGGLRRGDHLLVPDGPSWRDDGPHPGVQEHL